MKKLINNLGGLVSFLFIITMVVLIFRHLISQYDLKTNGRLTIGKVTKFKSYSRTGGGKIYFSYEVNGKKYTGMDVQSKIYKSEGYHLVGKEFPVMFDTTDVPNCTMLITEDDFMDYAIPFPDSLQWVKEYMKN